MATNRVDILKQMVSQAPGNSFARYGLAMEYANTGQFEEAASEFRVLLQNDENYTAAYFHAGQTLEKLNQIEDARAMYEKGIEICERKGDEHTRSEIEAAMNLLPI